MPTYFALSKADILAIHKKLILQAEGFNSESNLDFIFGGLDEFPEKAGVFPQSVEEKIAYLATYLLFHLVKGHCFNDGNKRAAFVAFGAQLIENGLEPTYSEQYAHKKLDTINEKIEGGQRPLDAINETFSYDFNSPEYKIIWLVFELAGGNENVTYDSPLEIYPIVHSLIKWKRKGILEDRAMVTEKTVLPTSKFKAIPADHDEVMRIADELIKKYPRIIKILEKA